MSEVAELTARLVEIESINPDVVAGGSGESGVARFVAEWCERAGLDTTLQDAAPGRPNVTAVARGTGAGRSLMLNAHMDTVGVAEMADPFAPRLDNGRLYGRGAYDMKGSVGTEAVAARHRADAAIVTEPTELQVAVAHRGFVYGEVETRGRAAHGSRPDLGIDAIAKMGRVLVGIEQLDKALRAHPTHPYLGSGSVHASLIEGGQEYSSYPARCVLQAERRTIPGETVQSVESELKAVVHQAAENDADFAADMRVLASREPFEVDEGQPIVQSLRRHATAVLGREPDFVGVPFWADSALLADAGIPTVVFGPGGGGAHAEVEWVEVADLERCVEIYVAVAGELCA